MSEIVVLAVGAVGWLWLMSGVVKLKWVAREAPGGDSLRQVVWRTGVQRWH